MTATIQYDAVFKVAGAHARIDVNDIPVWSHEARGAVVARVPLNSWIVGGVNDIRVHIAWPEEVEPGSGSVEIQIAALEEDRSNPNLVLTWTWAAALAKLDVSRRAFLRYRKYRDELRLQVDAPPPTSLWSMAEPVALTDGDRRALLERCRIVQLGLDHMDVPLLEGALGYRMLELASAQGSTVDDVKAQLLLFLAAYVGDETVDPRSEEGLADLEENFEIHSVARGKLVWVTRAERRAVLRCPAMNPAMELQIYFAKLKGSWVIVR